MTKQSTTEKAQLEKTGSAQSKRKSSEPFVIPWEDGEAFKLSEDYIKTFYVGKENLDDHPYWSYNDSLIGPNLIMNLHGKEVYDEKLSLEIHPQYLIVSCECNRNVQLLCRHACSAILYRTHSNKKYFEQFYFPQIIKLNAEQQQLFHFDLNRYYGKGPVAFKTHPVHGRVYRYVNQDRGESYDYPIKLVIPFLPRTRVQRLVFGVPTESSVFPLPILLPYLTRTGTKTSKINPYASFESSYLLTGEGRPNRLSIQEEAIEARCKTLLRIVGLSEGEVSDLDLPFSEDPAQVHRYVFRKKKQLLALLWKELIPLFDDNIKFIFFDGSQSSSNSIKPTINTFRFSRIRLASVRLTFTLEEETSWYQLRLLLFIDGQLINEPTIVNEYCASFIALEERDIVFISNVQDEEMLQQFRQSNFMLTVLKQDFSSFYEEILLPISERYFLDIRCSSESSIFSFRKLERFRNKLKLEVKEETLLLFPSTIYPVGFVVNPMVNANVMLRERGGKVHVLQRDKEAESEFVVELKDAHPSFEAQLSLNCFHVPLAEIEKTTWLPDCLLKLQKSGVELDVSAIPKGGSYFPYLFSCDLEIWDERNGVYYLSIDARWGKRPIQVADLEEIVMKSKSWFILQDGTFGVISQRDKDRLRPLFCIGRLSDQGLEIPTSRFDVIAKYRDNINKTEIINGIHAKRKMLLDMEAGTLIEQPTSVKADLRPYQRVGVTWLAFLRQLGWGGVLADDMGLGKTLQVISVLEYHYQQEPLALTSLIVAPNTLLFNWEEEYKRFAPHRKIFTHHGSERHQKIGHENGTILLTTYGTLVADVDFLSQLAFSYLVLDESQSVKNRSSKRYDAASQLNAQYRIAMTGTPIENGISDLYAQLSFVNPGFFGTFSNFKKIYKGITDGSASKETKDELLYTINPFILRRTKKQVATDLPDKSEMLLYCEMLPEQRRIYDDYRSKFKSRLLGSLEKDGMDRSKFIAIEGMMKLRQICNSPALLKDDNHSNISAKLDEIMDHICEQKANHKILVFSSFTSMLYLLRDRLKEVGLEYAYLDGKCDGAERQQQVKLFQETIDCRLFLLSLKAGGTGLNLTAADYVYILDPWWNPAAEAQAIDRCYRIGQDKHVMAYRMICKDSIEEKILQMQANKRALADTLIQEEANVLKSLNKEELLRLFD